MSNNADEIAAFMNELEESRPARAAGGRRGATYDILKPEFGKIYRNYAILSFNHGTSPLGAESVVVRMVNMDTGRREKIYLQSYEIQDWDRFVKNNEIVTVSEEEDGKKNYNLPVLCDFLKQKEESQKNPVASTSPSTQSLVAQCPVTTCLTTTRTKPLLLKSECRTPLVRTLWP